VIVGVALVIDGVHYSSDVAASALWSIGVAPMVLQAWNRLILPRTYRARSLS
jgi:membrane-associated phospholipid phosphatase